MTFYSSFNDNHQAIIDYFKADATILTEVSTRNVIDYDYRLLTQKRFPAIAVPLPQYTPSAEGGGLGMVGYNLLYKIVVATDLIGVTKSRTQLQTIASRIMEIFESGSEMSFDNTCTFAQIVNYNPNLAVGGSEKALQRIGEIRAVTSHSIIRPQ